MKRFSFREIALLMAPICVIGVVGWWASRRPVSTVDDGKMLLAFNVDRPTTLEAFQGYDGAFVIKAKNRAGVAYALDQTAPYIESETAQEKVVSRKNNRLSAGALHRVWGGNVNGSRFTFRARFLPPGKLRFGFDALAQPMSNSGAMPKPVQVQAKWRVNRATIRPLALAAMPRKPLLSLRQINIVSKTSSNDVKGEAVFHLDGVGMNEQTPFILDLNSSSGGVSWSSGTFTKAKPTALTRVIQWTVSPPCCTPSQPTKGRVSGRASADNRWPLGFEIEPFNFKTVKIGQKLKFKQFPVALPKK